MILRYREHSTIRGSWLLVRNRKRRKLKLKGGVSE